MKLTKNLSLVNHSQLTDAKKSWEELWAERTGFKKYSPDGFQTSLGHTYSIILESLAQEGVMINPDASEFLRYVANKSTRSVSKELTLKEPSYDYVYGQAIYDFMSDNGLSPKKRSEIMKEIIGWERPCYTPQFQNRCFTK